MERAKTVAAWTRMNDDRTYETMFRPDRVPLDAAHASIGGPARDSAGVLAELKNVLGGDEKVFSFTRGYRVDINVNAANMARHLVKDLNRSAFLPLIPEIVEEPYEIWAQFLKGSKGQVALRHTFVKAIQTGKGRGYIFVANANEGHLTGWTFYPVSNMKDVNKYRWGNLVYGRGESK